MTNRPSSGGWWLLFASLACGLAFSLGKLALHCRRPVSEACVWGKAYLPFTLPAEMIVVGGACFIMLLALRRLRG